MLTIFFKFSPFSSLSYVDSQMVKERWSYSDLLIPKLLMLCTKKPYKSNYVKKKMLLIAVGYFIKLS